MRKITVLLVIVLIAIISAVSCTKTCDNAYEGKQCNIPVNLKFAGQYAITDTALINNATDRRSYSMSIIAGAPPATIIFKNFGGTDSSLTGTAGGNSFTIATSTIGQNQIANTTGSLSDSILTFTYMVIDSTDTVARYASGKNN